mmetsp:Transcript_10154/g.16045  ORF Transcript_10154/g.16045 Transcript_10154/m.16045 type:complete len:203 (+) Transcript_10154:3-611(+)
MTWGKSCFERSVPGFDRWCRDHAPSSTRGWRMATWQMMLPPSPVKWSRRSNRTSSRWLWRGPRKTSHRVWDIRPNIRGKYTISSTRCFRVRQRWSFGAGGVARRRLAMPSIRMRWWCRRCTFTSRRTIMVPSLTMVGRTMGASGPVRFVVFCCMQCVSSMGWSRLPLPSLRRKENAGVRVENAREEESRWRLSKVACCWLLL